MNFSAASRRRVVSHCCSYSWCCFKLASLCIGGVFFPPSITFNTITHRSKLEVVLIKCCFNFRAFWNHYLPIKCLEWHPLCGDFNLSSKSLFLHESWSKHKQNYKASVHLKPLWRSVCDYYSYFTVISDNQIGLHLFSKTNRSFKVCFPSSFHFISFILFPLVLSSFDFLRLSEWQHQSNWNWEMNGGLPSRNHTLLWLIHPPRPPRLTLYLHFYLLCTQLNMSYLQHIIVCPHEKNNSISHFSKYPKNNKDL